MQSKIQKLYCDFQTSLQLLTVKENDVVKARLEGSLSQGVWGISELAFLPCYNLDCTVLGLQQLIGAVVALGYSELSCVELELYEQGKRPGLIKLNTLIEKDKQSREKPERCWKTPILFDQSELSSISIEYNETAINCILTLSASSRDFVLLASMFEAFLNQSRYSDLAIGFTERALTMPYQAGILTVTNLDSGIGSRA